MTKFYLEVELPIPLYCDDCPLRVLFSKCGAKHEKQLDRNDADETWHYFKRPDWCPLKPALTFSAYNANKGKIENTNLTLVQAKPAPRCGDCICYMEDHCGLLGFKPNLDWYCADFEVRVKG